MQIEMFPWCRGEIIPRLMGIEYTRNHARVIYIILYIHAFDGGHLDCHLVCLQSFL